MANCKKIMKFKKYLKYFLLDPEITRSKEMHMDILPILKDVMQKNCPKSAYFPASAFWAVVK